jgi:hypothetical protein
MSNLQNVQTFKNIPQEKQALVISKLIQPIIRLHACPIFILFCKSKSMINKALHRKLKIEQHKPHVG